MEITRSLFHVGVTDNDQGMIYNSYVLKDQQAVIFDVVDFKHFKQWLENIENVLQSQEPDYLVLSSYEHSDSIQELIHKYPHITIIDTHNKESLKLTSHTLIFLHHLPTITMTYILEEKVLMSSYMFSTYGYQHCLEETRRYYFNTIGQYGLYVQQLLKQIKTMSIDKICPLHGPILQEQFREYIHYHNIWSQYMPQFCHVLIAYTTSESQKAHELAELLENQGETVVLCNLMKKDMSYALTDAFLCDRIVFMNNDGELPAMLHFIQCLKNKNFQSREVAFVTSQSKILENAFQNLEDIEIVKPIVYFDDELYNQKIHALVNSLINGGCTGEFCD